MSALIKATGVSVDATITSSIEHAVNAGKQCLDNAGIDIEEVSYIFNVGVYRDHNMVEPSMAALIQKGLGINRDFVRWPVSSPTFSTDLMNGASGAINAIHVAKALLKAGRKGYVLITSSDAHPSMKSVEGFPITPCGAAMLIGSGDGKEGFQHFCFADTLDHYIGQSSYVDFELHELQGRETIEIETEADYYEKLVNFAKLTALGFITKHQIDLKKTLMIAPSLDQEFATRLGSELSLPKSAVIDLWPKYKNPNTSAFTLGYHSLRERQDLNQFEQVLFVGVGAGLNSCCALYHL